MVHIKKIRPLFQENKSRKFLGLIKLPKRTWIGEEVPALILKDLKNGAYNCSKSSFVGVAR